MVTYTDTRDWHASNYVVIKGAFPLLQCVVFQLSFLQSANNEVI